ncbi:MAG: hypothetical protein GXX85_11375 [Ignavibacteria bacterium]|nr:hypothetical protein [Ignavibacteria bacterium]
MKEHYLKLFEFNNWANTSLISHLSKSDNIPDKCVKLMSHIIGAQDLWFERVRKNKEHTISPWDEYSLPECKILSGQSTTKWTNYIKRASEKSLEETISYFDLKGNYHEDKFSDVLTHLLNHSSYHRGQINMLLSSAGLKPAAIDFIIYARQSD